MNVYKTNKLSLDLTAFAGWDKERFMNTYGILLGIESKLVWSRILKIRRRNKKK